MKAIPVLPLLAFLMCQPIFGAADLGAADAKREADHTALRQLRDRAVTAINQFDGKTLSSCFAKEFAFTTVTQEVLTNQEQVQAFFDRMFRAPDALLRSMTTEPTADILTRFIDENTGICYGSTKDTYTLKSGEVVTMNNRWSATVVKQDGEWKVAMAHVGTDFLNNPVLNHATSFAKKLALGAGFGGLLLGWVLARLMSRGNKSSDKLKA